MKISYLITTIVLLGIAMSSYGQIGWWPFNGNANDESGNGNHGTNMGATLTTDRFGNDSSAYQFDGQSSYITIPSSASLESPTTRLSVSAWAYLDGVSQVGDPLGPIVMKSNSAANAFMYRLFIGSNLSGLGAGTNNWTQNVGASYAFQLGQWYMLTAVLDSSVAYHYVNDSLISTQAYTTNIANNTLPLEIGRDVPGLTEVFNGKLDDIGIWDRALDSLEVDSLFNYSTQTGIAEQGRTSRFQVYPNPTNGLVQIVGVRNERVVVFNALGKMVITTNATNTIDLATLSEGLYFIQVVGDNGQIKYTTKILKE